MFELAFVGRCPRLSVGMLTRAGVLREGRGAKHIESITLRVGAVEQTVSIARAPTGFTGGRRPLFVCPRCRHRRAVLYVHDGVACRDCHGLIYTSQSVGDIDNLAHQQRKLARRMSGRADATRRQPRMRRTTHARLLSKWIDLEIRFDQMIEAKLEGFRARYGSDAI